MERSLATNYAIKVISDNGEEGFLCDSMGNKPTKFFSRREAQEMVNFLKIGMDGDVQSINIVPYPKAKAS